MKRHITKLVVLVVAVSVAAHGAHAGTIRLWRVFHGGAAGALAGTVSNDIFIDAGPTEQIGEIQIYAHLTEGLFYQHVFGGNTPPNPAFFPLDPAVAFDTFVASGVPTNARIPGILGASVDLGSPNTGGAAVFNATTIDATFRPATGQDTLGALNFLAARLTISGEGMGTFRMDVEFSGGGPHVELTTGIFSGVVGCGLCPEPTSLTLFCLGIAVSGLARRRRSI